MKQFTLFTVLSVLITMNAMSQQPLKNYDSYWKKVEGFVKKDLPASALTEVKKIYALAKKDKQETQVIKSLVYMQNLQYETREENDQLSIKETEQEAKGASGITASLLNSLLASQYWTYFQNNRWRFYNRSNTVAFKKDDIATWTASDFHQRITELYFLALKEKNLLQRTSLKNYDAIILKGNMRHLRPTLYDLVAFSALNYFMNDERDVNKPAYAFEIDQASAFDPAADFIHRKFPTQDSSAALYKALLIFQDLLAFHLNDAKPDALIDADLIRYQFVYGKSTHPDKKELYYNGINHIAHQYGDTPAAAQAWYLVAEYHNMLGSSYDVLKDTSNRFERVKAKEIAEKIAAGKDSSEGRVNAYNLLSQLNQENLTIKTEQVNLPGKPFRALVEYTNLTVLNLRIVKATPELKKIRDTYPDDNYWKAVTAAPPVRSWKQEIPDTKDLQLHRVEIRIDALPSGEYYLLGSSKESFTDPKAVAVADNFYVSSISYFSHEQDFFVLNRENGQPLRNASVQIWEQEYDYNASRNIRTKGPVFQTDDNGYFRLKTKALDRNKTTRRRIGYTYAVEISTKDDHLFIDQFNTDYPKYKNSTAPTTELFLFIDRDIYRPGQTVYLKGIVISLDGSAGRSTILPNYTTTVRLNTPNGDLIDSLKVTTNEFGSFSGKFQLPASGVTGMFSVVAQKEHLYKSFSVEEYKRPKFFVEYEPVKGTYRINDSVTVTGAAKAYAGNNISGASVKYRVIRQSRFPYMWLFRSSFFPQSKPLEIAHGEISTDEEGKFRVTFKAIPDASVDEKLEPSFDYVIYADVTDINGETRSEEKSISVSYKSLLLKVQLPERMPADSLNKITIRTENNSGEFQPAQVTVKIARLKAENRLIRKRVWPDADQFVFTKDEYLKYFPYDQYNKENDPTTWPKEEQVLQKTDSTQKDKPFVLDGMISQAGVYVIEIFTKDKDGKEVKDLKYVTLYDNKSSKPEQATYFTATNAPAIEPGQSGTVEVATTADNVFLIQQIRKRVNADSLSSSYSFIRLSDEKKKLRFEAEEKDRGGFGVSWAFIKHNQFFSNTQVIPVPWTNKELNIEYASYRDKTLPGSKEQWRLKISGAKKDQVAAELVAGMYDASLDQFTNSSWWVPNIWPVFSQYTQWEDWDNFGMTTSRQRQMDAWQYKNLIKIYDHFIFSASGAYYATGGYMRTQSLGNTSGPYHLMLRSMPSMQMDTAAVADPNDPSKVVRYTVVSKKAQAAGWASNGFADESQLAEVAISHPTAPTQENGGEGMVQPRKNFNETAFFFPDLKTDANGAVEFSFTMPEALTKWKFQALAHTKDLAFGYSSKEIITQKELMVQPNTPRFLREGDQLVFNAKIVNLSDKPLNGTATLQLFNAATNQPVDILFNLIDRSKSFNIAPGQSTAVFFPLNIPASYTEPLTWRIIAKAENFSDGEENVLPVLSNRMLVIETMSLPMRGNGTKTFSFDKFKQSGNSSTLKQHSLTLEYTSNPAWYAVQALPYLMEYPYDCAEQTWNRYYANSLASSIANAAPKLRQLFEQWKTTDTAALMSNLQKNQELKYILLEETPWVLAAKTEAQQKQNIALLFDMIRMSSELNSAYEKIKQLQSSNGGFVWFKGGPDDRYMTQYIVTGIGHLLKLKAVNPAQSAKLKEILQTAIPYLDRKMKEAYDQLVKSKVDLKKIAPDYSAIHYFYMRSFFPDYKIDPSAQKAYNYFRSRLPADWTMHNKYMQGMVALALHRLGDKITPVAILKSLKETSINNEELGMYWKDANRGWWWYESPVERQALLIEAFQEISKDTKTIDDLRTWLLKNKQTNKWESTRATAEACYALLLQGNNWINDEPAVTVKLGDITVKSTDNKLEAGTGYFSKTFQANEIKPTMGNVSVTVTGSNTSAPSWGGVYWQYFENLDKITTAATPLQLQKKLFVETNTDRGPVLTPVQNGAKLKIGNKIKVRIELRVDRNMEYVHMKDMRASALEPVNVLSSYKWQDGLGYYESTRDAATNFFFSDLRKGTYVFEYTLFVTHAGNFSNGVTTIQCMYAPEFTAHSEGIRISVE